MVEGCKSLRLLTGHTFRDACAMAAILGALGSARSIAQAEPVPRVPEGFVIERVADDSSVRFPMFGSVDERGRLFIAESSGLDLYQELSAQTRKCQVRMLEDRDGDGLYETATVFADRLVFPMGLAWHKGRLFVADPPDLIALKDTDDDGRADRRQVILSGFGYQDNGSLHGLRIGPDGRLYMTMGSPDGYQLPTAEGLVSGTSGALIRCRTDGSQVEVLCRGFVNLVEIAFLPTGEVIGTDNWFQRPQGGIRDALVHLVAGGLYPYLPDTGTPQPLTGIELPAVTRLPAVAVSGLECYRGAAFPPEFHGNLFSAQHNARAVSRHVLVRDGATFRSDDHPFVTSDDPDFHPSDVLEDVDGSLIVIDTGGWYVQHCPTGRIRDSYSPGAVYRVRHVGARTVRTAACESGGDEQPLDELIHRLSDTRPHVRELARGQLVARGAAAVPHLTSVIQGTTGFAAKEHALWGLAAIDGDASELALQEALAADDEDVAALAARVCGVRGCRAAAGRLERLLSHEGVHVRQAAAEALARCGGSTSLAPIVAAIATADDPFFKHSLIYAIHCLASADDLSQLASAADPELQAIALRLLDQPPRSGATLGLTLAAMASPDAHLRTAGVFIVQRHPEWSDNVAGQLRQWLMSKSVPPAPDPSAYGLVSALLADPTIARVAAEALAAYQNSGQSARIGELLRAIERAELQEVPDELVGALRRLIVEGDAAASRAAMRTIGILGSTALDVPLSEIAGDVRQATSQRLAALHALRGRNSYAVRQAWDVLRECLSDDALAVDRLVALEIVADSPLTAEQLEEVLPIVVADPLISPASLVPLLSRSVAPATAGNIFGFVESSLRRGWMPTAGDLQPLLESLAPFDNDRAARLRQLADAATEDQRARLRQLEPLLSGGDAVRGRSVFFTHQAACAKCHRVGEEGGSIGPELTRIGAARTAHDLLESIVVPSATIAQGYELHQLVTTDGRTVAGTIIRQDDSHLLLRNVSGSEQRIARDDVDQLHRASASNMPDGLDRMLTREELRDVIAFLVSLR